MIKFFAEFALIFFSTKSNFRFSYFAGFIWVCCLKASNDRTRYLSRVRFLCSALTGNLAACICSRVRCMHTNISRVATGNDCGTRLMRRRTTVYYCFARNLTACWMKMCMGSVVGSGHFSAVSRMCATAPWSGSLATRRVCVRARMWKHRWVRDPWQTSNMRVLSSLTTN